MIASGGWLRSLRTRIGSGRSLASGGGQEAKVEKVEKIDADLLAVAEDDEAAAERAASLSKSRDKSRLSLRHRELLHRIPPSLFDSPYQLSLSYRRKLFGTYGFASEIDPHICWMSPEEFASKKEYESLLYDKTIHEMVKIIEEKKAFEKKDIMERQEYIEQRIAKLDQWKTELRNKKAKQLQLATATKLKKEKLVEEVRRHFGFKIDPKDARFQTLLAEKEKQQKKAEKQAKKAAREAQLILHLQKKNAEI